MRVHAKAKGIEPISGLRYSAINPEAQRWVHITGWQSVLKCYERYGPGRFRMSRNPGSGLSRGSRRSYIPASPPMSRRRETRSARISPTFAASCAPPSTPTGRCAMCSGRLATAARGCGRVLAPAAIATLPKMGAPHGQLRPAGRGGRGRRARCAGDGAAAVGRQFPPAVAMARRLVPQTAEVLAQHLTAGPRALRPTIAPAEA